MPQPFEGGLGSFKLYILLGRFLKYAYKGPPTDAGAVLHVSELLWLMHGCGVLKKPSVA